MKAGSKPLSAISLYTGAGGLDLGFESAGFETQAAVELDNDCVETLRQNRPQWRVIHGDIESPEAASKQILKRAGLKVGEVDVLIGGPPCQPFSKSGYWARGDALRLDDPRAATLGEYLRVLRDVQPRAFLLENVPGLAFSKKDEGLRLLEAKIEQINAEVGTQYSFNVELLRAVEHGVPQDRQRVFVIGSRDGSSFKFPRPSHMAPLPVVGGSDDTVVGTLFDEHQESRLLPYSRTWDAIGDLEGDDDPTLRLTGKWADLVPSIPEGTNYLYHTDRGKGVPLFGWRRRYWNFLLKLAKRLPSWTIAAQPGPAIGPFHWKNRRLSAIEMMRLQTFPDGYTISGNLRSAQRQLGNAVPSALAERLALAMRQQIFGDADANPDALKLLPRRRMDLPAPEPVRPVPRKYLPFKGKHEAHPGTGLGYAALKRAKR
jgi:DNA (cytosine-5)-methyltransferase 1